VKIQALFRGAKVRKQLALQMTAFEGKQHFGRRSFGFGGGTFEGDPAQLDEKKEVVFKNGAVYTGQWLGSEKHGFGVQVWPDGARYEGQWEHNKAHGKGKFWHVDGDVFEGMLIVLICSKGNGRMTRPMVMECTST